MHMEEHYEEHYDQVQRELSAAGILVGVLFLFLVCLTIVVALLLLWPSIQSPPLTSFAVAFV